MTSGLTPSQAKTLTMALYAVLFVLCGVTTWLAIEVYGMPEKYVRLERYQRDADKVESTMDRIDCKLDRLIERLLKP